MRNALFQAICKVGIFMICAQAIVHFRPREVYEKYLRLLVSVMILIQLFLPFGGFLLGGGMGEVTKRLAIFSEGLEQELSLSSREAEEADRLLEQMTLEEVRRRLEGKKNETDETSTTEEVSSEISVTVEPVVIDKED